MKINTIISGVYSVIQHTEGQFKLVRVLGYYESEVEAERELQAILNGRKTEREVEHAYHQSLTDS
ncbi:hypothetical protein ACFOZY_00940 [Chungangia koreensis]|uniref:Uncharacterized protein n=1 Tax=Chungangia koreensis TaxID=752657 RepID=A0ABV8WZA8_9LACT